MEHRKLTQAELLAECKARFGESPLKWAFVCPNCGDAATGLDFSVALNNHPRTGRDGEPVMYWQIIGQECIGRTIGALSGPPTSDQGCGLVERGCDWAAYGLIRGPWEIVTPDGESFWCFPLADATAVDEEPADEVRAEASA